ncbi:MAG: hypothetical protein R3C49_04645 [Planctomycetaceae bacterium]
MSRLLVLFATTNRYTLAMGRLPHFSGFESLTWSISVCAAVSAAVVAIVVLRRYEASLVSRPVGRMLLAFRIAVLCLLLVTMLQPVLTETLVETVPSRLIIGIDASASMETADPHAVPEETLLWAQALGMTDAARTQEQLARWAESGSNDGTETFNRPVQDAIDELKQMNRLEFVRRLLTSEQGLMSVPRPPDSEVTVAAFGDEVQPISEAQLCQLSPDVLTSSLKSETDIAGFLNTALTDRQSEEFTTVLLLTDGRHTADSDVAAQAARLGTLGIPVFCVPIGSRRQPRDLSISEISVPEAVFPEDSIQVQVGILGSGFSGDTVTVQLSQDGQPIESASVTLTGDVTPVPFTLPPQSVGRHTWTVAADLQPNELRADNNARDFSVSVVDTRSKVMIVEGDARWEFRYLLSALQRDRQVKVSNVLFSQPWLHLLNRTFLDSELPPAGTLKTDLAKSDLLILGDVSPDDLPETALEVIEQAVSEDGLTLVMIPGNRHMPLRYQSPVLEKLLPVSAVRHRSAERQHRTLPGQSPAFFRMQLTPAGEAQAVFQFHQSGQHGERRSPATLPGHPWVSTAAAKPAATVWADAVMEGEDLNGDTAVAVHQYYGFGQVLWLGIDSTWRWRLRSGDRWHHQFWGQLVRWATQNKSAAGNDQVRMTLSQTTVPEQTSVDVSVRWQPELLDQLKGADVEVVVSPQQSAGSDNSTALVHRIPLLQQELSPTRFTGSIPGLPPGLYDVRLQAGSAAALSNDPICTPLNVIQSVSDELANLSCHRDFLQQLAGASGGRLVEPWQLKDLTALFPPATGGRRQIQETNLWTHWILMLSFFALLMGEWTIRRIHGLP